MSNFGFLQSEWPELFADAQKAEALVIPDPRTACFYTRRTLESVVAWLYKSDPALKLPIRTISARSFTNPLSKPRSARRFSSRPSSSKTWAIWPRTATSPCSSAIPWSPCASCSTSASGWRAPMAKPHKPADGLAVQSVAAAQNLAGPAANPGRSFSSLKRSSPKKTRSLTALLTGKTPSTPNSNGCAPRSPHIKQQNAATPGHARLLRSRDPRLLHRPAAERGRLAARQARKTASSPVTGMPNSKGQGLRRLRAVGRRRQAARAGRGQAHQTRCRASASSRPSSTPIAWRSSSASGPVIFYTNGYEHWLWDDADYPPRAGPGLLQEGRAGAADPAARQPRSRSAAAAINRRHRRALLPDTRHPPDRRGLRAGPRAQGAAGDGDRRRQDPHRDRAVRPADALQLGQARAVPRRPRGAGQPGRKRLQDAPARRPRR